LSTNGLNCHATLASVGIALSFPAGGEDFRAHVAAGPRPLVVLLRPDRAAKPAGGVSSGGEAADAGAPAGFFFFVFLGIVAPHLAPDFAGERGEGEDVVAGVI